MKKFFTTVFWIGFFGSSNLTTTGYVALFIISFTESCCFIIPPDALLPFIAFGKDLKTIVFITLFTSFASICGAVCGYLIGKFGGQPLLHKLFSRDKTDKVEKLLQKYDAWAIGIAAFTPIPYKVFTIAAGVFNLHFIRFLIVSILARTTRYMLVALIAFYSFKKLGWTQEHFDAYLHSPQFALLTFSIFGGVIVIYLLFRFIKKNRKPVPRPA